MEEELFLGLRKSAGVSKKRFADKFGVPIANVFGLQIREQTEKGLLNDGQDSISLTHQGKLLGNEVFQAFLGVVPAE